MMVKRQVLINYLDKLLTPKLFRDYCPNGLQVEGKQDINHIISGVSASKALLDAAIDNKADAILVHHGYFWRGEENTIVGIKKHRLMTLLQHNVNLLAYHLPLDAHEIYGNNVKLAQLFGINITSDIKLDAAQGIGLVGTLVPAISASAFGQLLTEKLQRPPLHIAGCKRDISTIAWCSGAAQDMIEQAVHYGADAYLTGEVSERTFHLAKELKIHFFAAGHHATERYGVMALGQHLAQHFDLNHQFIDINNPV